MVSSSQIKSVQDIMRKDRGINGDAQRIEQLVWMIFLKVLDDDIDLDSVDALIPWLKSMQLAYSNPLA